MRKRSPNLTLPSFRPDLFLNFLSSLLFFAVVASLACSKSDDGLTSKLLDANSKVLACQKELAEAKAARDSLKRQLALALANPSKIQLTDPEIIELVASVRKERSGTADLGGDLNPKEASTIVMNGAPALQACYERALKRNAALQMRTGLGVTLGITVKPVGEVEGVDVLPSVDAEMTKCMKTTISRWKFPKFTGNAVTIEQKLTLTPKT
jgi:hypothetical protein